MILWWITARLWEWKMFMFRKKARPVYVIYLSFMEDISLYQRKGSKMKRESGAKDIAERYKQDIFKYAKQKYGAEPDYPWVKSPESAVLRHKDNAKWFALLMTVAKTSLGLNDPEIVNIINVKCDPVLIGSLIREKGCFPAYHMNKEHWITVLLDGSVSINELYNLIDLSYDLSK